MLLIFFSCFDVLSQKKDVKSHLYKLENKIMSGDIAGLKELALFLDDTTFVQEFLGYHNWPNNARRIAIRIIEENCLFTDDEFKIDSTISALSFLKILNNDKMVFDDLTGMFLMTSLTERSAAYELKKISDFELRRFDTTVRKAAFPDWYYEDQIDGFLFSKNPEALKWIASAWFKQRTRFNRYYFNDEEFTDLIKKLTRSDLGVQDEKGKITFLYKDDYYAKARLNYLIYWTNHYSDYKWNEEKNFFENSKDLAGEKSKEEILFELLDSEDDSIAIGAYVQLTELDTLAVKRLASEYEANNIHNNYSLPTFLYRFLRQTALLTQYCRDNQVSYKAAGWLKDSLNKLKQDLNYRSRYRLENYLVQSLDLDVVTEVEYYGLIYEEEWNVTYSIGRILDKFYSRKWKELVSDKRSLLLYLKKTKLFDDLGIIGICNKYRRKFKNCSELTINNLKSILSTTTDRDITEQVNKILATYAVATPPQLKKVKGWKGNNGMYGANNLKSRFNSIKAAKKEDDDKKSDIQELFGKINYGQIGKAIKILIKDTSLNAYDKFHFLESDFGFSINIEDSLELENFMSRYFAKSEKHLYEYYLRETGMNCFDMFGNLYYPGIYEILKYDIVDAFVGGGGGRREDGVYLVIKLLELKFKTTLGFPEKLCSWRGIYACHCDDRAKKWMKVLVEKGLVKPDVTDPPSISYND